MTYLTCVYTKLVGYQCVYEDSWAINVYTKTRGLSMCIRRLVGYQCVYEDSWAITVLFS